eukprot:2526222-Prymnesium_polylepis.1
MQRERQRGVYAFWRLKRGANGDADGPRAVAPALRATLDERCRVKRNVESKCAIELFGNLRHQRLEAGVPAFELH